MVVELRSVGPALPEDFTPLDASEMVLSVDPVPSVWLHGAPTIPGDHPEDVKRGWTSDVGSSGHSHRLSSFKCQEWACSSLPSERPLQNGIPGSGSTHGIRDQA